ncbi:MAG: MFS transporter [Alphaproteobacteria bacterium]|nr:MAG: MFS transporter [Alphaproteobacteria bacterium]
MARRRKKFSSDEITERSLQHSVRDGVTYSLMAGAGESYFSAFAVLLKASTAQVGAIATLPPMVASYFQLISVWLGNRTGWRKEIIIAGAIIQALMLIPLAILPLLFPAHAVPILILCIILYYIGPHLGSPQWGSLMGAIVPESKRGRFFARRTRYCSIASFSALIGAGLTLQLFDSWAMPYYGFMTIFLAASVARGISTWHLLQMVDPGQKRGPKLALFGPNILRRLTRSRFIRFSLFFALMQFAVAISGPFIVVHMLRDLHFSYVELTFNNATSVLFQILTLSRWGRLSDLFGNRLILVVTGFTIPFIPTLWTLSSNYYYLLSLQALSGVTWSGFTLSATNFVYDLTEPHRRAVYMAVHGTIAATAVFFGASFGGWLSTHLPLSVSLFGWQLQWEFALYGVFMSATCARLIVALLFLPMMQEVRRVRPMTPSGLIFRVTRFSNVSGLIFDPVLKVTNSVRQASERIQRRSADDKTK